MQNLLQLPDCVLPVHFDYACRYVFYFFMY